MSKSIYTKRSKLISEWLREKREEQGLSTRDFAKVSGLSKSKINRIEQGQRRVDLAELIIICDVLEADIYELVEIVFKN